ncbi:hypothetical protein ABFU82_11930 [Nocardioides sp. WV_118_6]
MATTYEDLVRAFSDQTLAALGGVQQGMIDALGAWSRALGAVVPDLSLSHELPTAWQDALGDPEAIIDEAHRFWTAVLELWRELVVTAFRASFLAPRAPYLPLD